jgi:hypothetical protein
MSGKSSELTMHESYQVQDGPDVTKVYLNTAYGRAVYDFRADEISQRKRLNDTETAADYWGLRAMLDGGLVTSHDLTIPWSRGCAPIRDSMTPAGHLIREQVDTLLRFAMLPHYDETGTP